MRTTRLPLNGLPRFAESSMGFTLIRKSINEVINFRFRINYFNLPDDNSTEIKDKMCTSDYLFIPYIQFLGTTHDVIAKLCSNKYEKDETFVCKYLPLIKNKRLREIYSKSSTLTNFWILAIINN